MSNASRTTTSTADFETLLNEIRSAFPSDFLSLEPQDLETYGRDWTKVHAPSPRAIAFPRSTEEVSQLLKLCTRFKVPVVPSGGRTGLAGGAVAAQGELVLNLSKMNKMNPVDTLAHTVRVQAGAVTEAVHVHCAAHGLTWPVDFASKGSSQVGGNIATNAGGVKVIRYGLTRNWVLGLQVVTMAGEVLELNGALEKNNTGLDLKQLFIGSEGILGVITEAVLKLTPLPNELNVFFFAVENIQAVLNLFYQARRAPFQVTAFEFLTQNCFEIVTKSRGLANPFQDIYPTYVLLEVERPNSKDGQEELDEWLEKVFEAGLVLDGTLAQTTSNAKELWNIREGISESLTNHGFIHKNDIALPISRLDSFVNEMYSVFSKRNAELQIYLFGHIGDGNLHVNTLMPPSWDKAQFLKVCKAADTDLFELVRAHQGSISAEHGIGLLKKAAIGYTRSAIELEFMRGIKKVFDPHGLMNPGKVL